MKRSRGNALAWVVGVFAIVLLGWLLFFKGERNDANNTAPGNQNATTTVNGTPNATSTFPLVGTQASTSEIVIESPKLGDRITSPLTVRGRATGPWYFEASAPVTVVDANGKILGQGFVMAEGEWMTTEFVPFSGTIRFSGGGTEGGAVVFMNDNPSGEPSRSKYMAVPVFFR